MGTQREIDLEVAIENHLVSIGYEQGTSHEFDYIYCILKEDLFRFLENTQAVTRCYISTRA